MNGSMTCTDCHDPHGQGYGDINANPLIGHFDDRQCTSCHPSKAEDVASHTFHPVKYTGSRCVACHMPYRQHRIIGSAVPPGVRTTRYRCQAAVKQGMNQAVPAPVPTATPNVGRELALQIQARWGQTKPRHPLAEAVIEATAGMPAEQAAGSLLRPDLDAPMLQFAAFSRYSFSSSGRQFHRAGISQDRDVQLGTSTDIDVAALALATLQITEGRTRSEAKALIRQQLASNPRIRSRVKVALTYLGWAQQLGGRPDVAVQLLTDAAELVPEDAATLEDLAGALVQTGQIPLALQKLTDAAHLEPNRVLTHMVLGLTLEKVGDEGGATAAYVRAAELNPWYPAPLGRLAGLLLSRGDYSRAEATLTKLTELDRANVEAQVALARLLNARGATADALRHLDTALAFVPSSQEALELRRKLIARTQPARSGDGRVPRNGHDAFCASLAIAPILGTFCNIRPRSACIIRLLSTGRPCPPIVSGLPEVHVGEEADVRKLWVWPL